MQSWQYQLCINTVCWRSCRFSQYMALTFARSRFVANIQYMHIYCMYIGTHVLFFARYFISALFWVSPVSLTRSIYVLFLVYLRKGKNVSRYLQFPDNPHTCPDLPVICLCPAPSLRILYIEKKRKACALIKIQFFEKIYFCKQHYILLEPRRPCTYNFGRRVLSNTFQTMLLSNLEYYSTTGTNITSTK